MNNGRPNYGGSGWNGGQQGQQRPGNGYTGQQPQQGGYGAYQQTSQGQQAGYTAYQQQPQQGGYGAYQQAPQGQQPGYTAYQQQPQPGGYGAYQQAPQGQQPGYNAYQQSQPGGYAAYQQNPQGGYNAYQQQPVQNAYTAYQQNPQGGYQAYQQQGYGQQNMQGGYYQQNPQGIYQNQINGYQPQGVYQQVPQPAARTKQPVNMNRIMMIVLCGVLPVLFIAAMILSAVPALKWVFAGLAAASVAIIWIKPVLPSNMKITFSALAALAMVVAIVSALTTAAPADPTEQPQNPGQQNTQQQSAGQSTGMGEEEGPGSLENVTITSAPVTDTPAPTDAGLSGECAQQMQSFFYFWSVNNTDSMLTLCAPSWQRSESEPKMKLFSILGNRIPVGYEMQSISGTDNDASRTITVIAEIDKRNGNATSKYIYRVVMLKEDGMWYVDPKSLASNEETKETTTNSMPTQPPTPAPGNAGTVLYYNPDGGLKYHIDPSCPSLAERYRPLTHSFNYTEINSGAYSELKPCSRCGAPVRPK